MFRSVALAALAAVSLSACASPLVTPNELSTQVKATNAIDWKRLATRTVAAIPNDLSGPRQKVYVASGPAGAAFAHTYKQFLEEQLIARNYLVLREPTEADIILDFDATILVYDKQGKKLYEYASLYTGVGSAATILRKVDDVAEGVAVGTVSGLLFDIAASMTATTKAEVVLTSTITSPRTNYYHFIRSEPFYVRKSDLAKYEQPPPGLPVVQLQLSQR